MRNVPKSYGASAARVGRDQARVRGDSCWALGMAALFAIIVATFALVRRAPAQRDPIELSSAEPCEVELRQSRALLLRSVDYRDSDRIVTLLTEA